MVGSMNESLHSTLYSMSMQFADKDDARDDDTVGHGLMSVCREYAVTRLDPLTCRPHCGLEERVSGD